MRTARFIPIQLLILLCLALLLACTRLAFAQSAWQAGDLIFRQGNEPVSDLVLAADRGLFSHVGILIGKPDAWQVLHATPEEVPGRGNAVVIDDLSFFISPERSLRYEVYHVRATSEERARAVNAAMQHLGEPFSIMHEGLYCTTLVEQAWKSAGVDLRAQYTHIQLPLLTGDYLLPSGLLASPLLEKAP